MDSQEVLRIHARRTLPIRNRFLHSLPRLHLVAYTLCQRTRLLGLGVRNNGRGLRLYCCESLRRSTHQILVVDRLRGHHRVNPLFPRLDCDLQSIRDLFLRQPTYL